MANARSDPRDALGLGFVVSSARSDVMRFLSQLLDGLPQQKDDREAVIFELAAGPEAARSVGEAVGTLIGNINLRAIAVAEGNLLFHAGAVCCPQGRVAVICGPSGSGKSTLTARLVESGLAYLTDETTCIEPITLQVTPFRKPLSLKRGSRRLFAQLQDRFHARLDWFLDEDAWLVPPAWLGEAQPPPGSLVPQVLVFPEYSTAKPPALDRLSQGEAAFMLGGNSSCLRSVNGGPLPALARLATKAPGFRIRYDDVDIAAARVRELLAA